MLTKEEFEDYKEEVKNILDTYVVTINLSANDRRDYVKVLTRVNSKHYVSWAVTKQVKFNPLAEEPFDIDCVTIYIDYFEDGFTICVDEKNCGINLDDFEDLKDKKYRLMNGDVPNGYRLVTYKTEDTDEIFNFVRILDKN